MAQGVSPLDAGHSGPLHAMQLDHFGNRLATASGTVSGDHCVNIWNVETRESLGELRGHAGSVWAVAWSHPMYGPIVASAGEDRRVIFWRECFDGDWCEVHRHETSGAALAAAFAPWEYGLQLAVASSDGNATIISCREPEKAETEAAEAGKDEAVGAEGKEIARATGAWRTETFKAHEGGAFAVCWAPATSPVVGCDSQYSNEGAAAAVDGVTQNSGISLLQRRLVTGGADNRVRIWRHDKLNDAWVDQHNLSYGEHTEHTDWVRDVAWRPNVGIPSNIIASCAEDGTVVIWKQLMSGQPWSIAKKWTLDAAAWQLSWSVTGSILAVSTSKNQVKLYKESSDGKWEVAEHFDEQPAD
eukprot:TRINITY_DN40667_c0_g1_i1.p1 TRINITY_DN40667_c0_g1~~TRINITY_DN40667_c0_g1_i1.p1  ORF type:complete len:358 (-),score=53.22 TRINITY_DN40667_c0_g1_i1:539-1612(-)